MKYAAAASNSNPITCLTSSLAGPVRGILLTQPGLADRTKYGAAIPMPIDVKITMIIAGGNVAAPAKSAPATKPKHGKPSTAVMTPNRNEPEGVSALGFTAYTDAGS